MASLHSGPLRAYRIADMRRPIVDGIGAMIYGARWNSPGRRVIYAAETYAGALLEVLVHSSGRVPGTQGFIAIDLPKELPVEVVSEDDVPDWDAAVSESARRFGDRWYDERRTVALMVPSVVTRVERNLLINQDHPDFGKLHATEPMRVRWDSRLWAKQ